MKIYLFYIPLIFLQKKIAYTTVSDEDIISDDGIEYRFYSFTTDKNKKERFLKERINNFLLITKNINKNEYEEFKKNKSTFELLYIKYDNYSYGINILSTMNEYNHCKYAWCEIFNEKNILSSLPYNLIDIIDNDYQEYLAILGLNSLVITYDEELSSMLVNSGYQFDEECVFNIDDQEYYDKSGRIATISLKLKPKEYNFYIHEFNELYK